MGRLAGLLVSKQSFDAAQVACVFQGGEEFLSVTTGSCMSSIADELAVDFLGAATDGGFGRQSRNVTLHGRAHVDRLGLHLEGDGGFAKISNFEYASDGAFTISFWMTKEMCSTDGGASGPDAITLNF